MGRYFFLVKQQLTTPPFEVMVFRSNFPEDSTLTPKEEFFKTIKKFPTIEKQLAGVNFVREFVRTPRLQYVSTKSVGDRYVLTNHSYGFIDPLYSSGLIQTFESVFKISHLLLSAFGKIKGKVQKGDFSAAAFSSIDALHKNQIKQSDRIVSNAYKAMTSFSTWNAWSQFWLFQVLFHDLWIQRACFRYFETGDKREFENFLDEVRPGDNAPFIEEKTKLLNLIEETLDAVSKKEITPIEASNRMLHNFKGQKSLPQHVFTWGDQNAKFVDFANPNVAQQLIGWGFQESPKHIRENLFDFKIPA